MQTDKEKWITARAKNALQLAEAETDAEMKGALLALCSALQAQAIEMVMQRKGAVLQELGIPIQA